MKRRLIIASQNEGKVNEIKNILRQVGYDIVGLNELCLNVRIIENKNSFSGNALVKARAVAKIFPNDFILAEDSGICLKALGGRPGVKSARWAGIGADAKKIISYTLRQLDKSGSKSRSAYFECNAVLYFPDKKYKIFRGQVFGKICDLPRGRIHQTLPYDQIFIPNGYTKTFSLMPLSRKNKISHRSVAFNKIKKFIILQKNLIGDI